MIADAKRGDIAGSARAYAQAVFGGLATPFGPSAGPRRRRRHARTRCSARDALAPFVDGAAAAGAGVFVLVRTSNPGAADLFDAELAAGGPLWERIAGAGRRGSARPGPSRASPRSARSTGATAPQHLARMRELMPHAPFLLPGHRRPGRHGRRPRAGVRARPRRRAWSAPRARSPNAHEAGAAASPREAARAEAERLREQAWALA